MPNETRVKPAARRACSDSAVTESGLASVVTSASGASPNSSRTAPSSEAEVPAGSSVGVPPPKNTVLRRQVAIAEHVAGQPQLLDGASPHSRPATRRRRARVAV